MEYKKLFTGKLSKLFPNKAEQGTVLKYLHNYKDEKDENGKFRVWLSILKCSKSVLTKIPELVELDKIDSRDFISLAEYPNQIKHGHTNDAKLQKQLEAADKSQFNAWLIK